MCGVSAGRTEASKGRAANVIVSSSSHLSTTLTHPPNPHPPTPPSPSQPLPPLTIHLPCRPARKSLSTPAPLPPTSASRRSHHYSRHHFLRPPCTSCEEKQEQRFVFHQSRAIPGNRRTSSQYPPPLRLSPHPNAQRRLIRTRLSSEMADGFDWDGTLDAVIAVRVGEREGGGGVRVGSGCVQNGLRF
jgi:hypothetical protein